MLEIFDRLLRLGNIAHRLRPLSKIATRFRTVWPLVNIMDLKFWTWIFQLQSVTQPLRYFWRGAAARAGTFGV